MMVGASTPGRVAVGRKLNAPLVARQSPLMADFQSILAANDIEILVEIDSFSLGAQTITLRGVGTAPAGTTPVGYKRGAGSFSYTPSTNYFSDRNFVSQAYDAPATTRWDGRVDALTVQRSVSLSPESYSQGDQAVSVTLKNDDGALDSLVANNAVDARRLRILIGTPGAPYSRFTVIFDGVANKWQMTSRKDVVIDAADNSYLMDQPMQTVAYAGTGGYEGGDAVLGQLKPLCYGQCQNVTPVLVDPVNLIYQVHNGPCQSIGKSGGTALWGVVFTPAVYDSGSALAFQADTANLYSGATLPGSYRTDLSRGLFQLGATPLGQVTADVQGDNDPAYADPQNGQPPFAHTVGQILLRVLMKQMAFDHSYVVYASFGSLDWEICNAASANPGTINIAAGSGAVTGTGTAFTQTFSLGQMIAANGETHTISAIASDTTMTTDAWVGAFSGAYARTDYLAGVYVVGANIPIVGESVLAGPSAANPYGIAGVVSQYPTDSNVMTARQFLDDRMKGVGGFWFFSRNRGLRVQRLNEPVTLDAVLTLTKSEIIDIKEIALPDAVYPPTWNRRVNYGQNWTVQNGSGLAAGVGAVRRQFLAIQNRTVQNQNLALKNQYPRAQNPPPVGSDLQDKYAAQCVADRLMALHGAKRQMLTVTLRPIGLQVEMGASVKIVFPRFGLQNGKVFRAFPTGEDIFGRTVTLTVWG